MPLFPVRGLSDAVASLPPADREREPCLFLPIMTFGLMAMLLVVAILIAAVAAPP